jgi:hypothetical protein
VIILFCVYFYTMETARLMEELEKLMQRVVALETAAAATVETPPSATVAPDMAKYEEMARTVEAGVKARITTLVDSQPMLLRWAVKLPANAVTYARAVSMAAYLDESRHVPHDVIVDQLVGAFCLTCASLGGAVVVLELLSVGVGQNDDRPYLSMRCTLGSQLADEERVALWTSFWKGKRALALSASLREDWSALEPIWRRCITFFKEEGLF